MVTAYGSNTTAPPPLLRQKDKYSGRMSFSFLSRQIDLTGFNHLSTKNALQGADVALGNTSSNVVNQQVQKRANSPR